VNDENDANDASHESDPTRVGGHGPGSALAPEVAARLKRDRDGLVCAVVQQHDSLEVLMVGWMDDEALHRTLTTGRVTFWSRSRGEYWRKGDTSGHIQLVRAVALDCDGDTLLVTVDQVGAACHTGDRSCFRAGALAVSGTIGSTESALDRSTDRSVDRSTEVRA
jgi:Phosphoribosyl-AMP cyclohydrolase